MKLPSFFFVTSLGFSMVLVSSTLHHFGTRNPNNLLPTAQSAPRGLRTDGDPAPPFPPPKPPLALRVQESTVIADGDPAPPFPTPPRPWYSEAAFRG
jgi:hypothetical protein